MCAYLRLVASLLAFAFLASSLLAAPASAAGPADETAKERANDTAKETARRQLRQVIFGSSESVGGSVHVGSGFKRALAGSIDEQGPIMMSLSGAGATGELFRHPAGITFVQTRLNQASALLFGYQWMGEHGVLMLAAGPEMAREQRLDRFGLPRWGPARRGAGFIAEVWTEPLPNTMAQATLTISGARASIWTRVAAGYAPVARVFVGPELTAYREDGYEEFRVGAHVTGLTLGMFTLRFNAGLVRATGGKRGAYFGVQTYFKI